MNGIMSDYLDGHILIAMPGMLDENFAETAVLLCAHSEEGAMGLVINRISESFDFERLILQLDLWDKEPEPAAIASANRSRPIHIGGPVDPSRGFVLHSPDYFTKGASVRVTDTICLTATVDILKAMARGSGPKHAMLALGYAAWDAGQLESEIQANGWLHTKANAHLVFDTPIERRYDQAFDDLGIDPTFLVTSAGHA